MLPNQLFPGAIPWRSINTENSVIRGSGVTLKDTNSTFGSVSTSAIPSRPEWSRTSDPFDLQERKRWAQTNHFLHVFDGVFDHGWYEFQLKYWCLCWVFFCKTQLPNSASKDLWCHQHCHISCSNHWKIRGKIVP